MYQLIQAILSDPEEQTRIKLLFAVDSEADILLKDELCAMEKRYPARFKVAWAISHPVAEDKAFHKGYVNRELLEKELMGCPKDGKASSKVFMCGPPAMEVSLVGKKGWLWNQKGILEEMGYGADQIRKF
jgi:cytochrome-b5 reductase